MHANTIIESRNASFFENVFPYKSTQKSNSSKRTHDTAIGNSQGQQDDDEPRRSKRTRTSKYFGPDFLTYLLEDEPQSFKEAMSSPEAPYWKEAINDEVESILQNHTWELVDLPSNQGMHLSLKMYFLTNPHRSQTQAKGLMILQ